MRERCEVPAFEKWRQFIASPENSPEAMEDLSRSVPAAQLRAAARLFATAGNAAIYYGLGVTEHAQGSTAILGIANLAMATGNLGREGVGVNPLRGQNNVQGSCDMGSMPHEFPGYRHVSDNAVREVFEQVWGAPLSNEPGLRIPNMFEAALSHEFMGVYINGEDLVQSDPNTQHVARGIDVDGVCRCTGYIPERNCQVRAHVLLPGSTFLEKRRHVPRMPSAVSPGCARSCNPKQDLPTGK